MLMKSVYFVLTILIVMLSACASGNVSPSAGNPPTAAVPTPTMVQPTVPVVQPTVPPSPTPAPVTPITRPSPTQALPAATATSVKPAPATGQCQNTYYPVVAGASWKYQVSGTSSTTFTRSIVTVRADGFDDQDVFSGVTRKGSWKCQQGSLTMLTPGSSPAVLATGTQTNFTVESNTGTTLPANLQPGTKWTQKIVYRGQLNISGTNLEGRSVMDLSCQAIGTEKVRVPAGEFNALRVDCSTKLEITVAGVPFDITVSGSSWYAPGVGLVKSRDSGEMGVTEIVLLSYTLP
jgi:hypothetical protein